MSDAIDYGPGLGRTCGHKQPWQKQCIRCEIVWHEHCLATAKAGVEKHTAKLESLRALSASEGAP